MTRPTLSRDPIGWLWAMAALAAVIYLLTLIPVIGHGLAVAFVILLIAGWIAGKFRREIHRSHHR